MFLIHMKEIIENLKAKMQGRELNIYQKADALIEFNKLIDYVEEQFELRSELLKFLNWHYESDVADKKTKQKIIDCYLKQNYEK